MKNDFTRYLWILLGLLPATVLHAQTGAAETASATAESQTAALPPTAEATTEPATEQTAGQPADANRNSAAKTGAAAAASSEPPPAVLPLPEQKPPLPKSETQAVPTHIEEVNVDRKRLGKGKRVAERVN